MIRSEIILHNKTIEQVNISEFLGSNISPGSAVDIHKTKHKIKFYEVESVPTLLYGSKT